MTRSRPLVTAATVCLLTSCSGDGSAPATTTPPTRATTTSTTSTSTTTSTSSTTTTSTTTTTTPPEVEFVVEQIADLPGRALIDPFSDGTSIVTLSRLDGSPTARAVMRVDTSGAIVQDVPVTDAIDLFGVIGANGRLFVHGYFEEPANPSTCGLRELDPATLLLGPSLALPTASGCGGGGVAVDDVNPAVITLPDVSQPVIFRVDTNTSVVSPVALAPPAPPDYRVDNVFVLDGVTFATMRPDFDVATGNETTAPDGSPLPTLLVRVDQAGAISVAEVAGFPRLEAGRLMVPLNDAESQVLDPSTLVPTEVVPNTTTPMSELVASGDGAAFSFDIGDGTSLSVFRRDPATGEITHQATVPVAFDATRSSSFRGFVIGEQFLVVATQQGFTTDEPSASLVFRASLRPVGG